MHSLNFFFGTASTESHNTNVFIYSQPQSLPGTFFFTAIPTFPVLQVQSSSTAFSMSLKTTGAGLAPPF